MNRQFRTSLVFVAICICMIATACQPSAPAATATVAAATAAVAAASPTAQAAATSAGAVEIKFFTRLSEPGKVWPSTIDQFNQKHTGKIHVTMSYVDDTTYKTKQPIELRSDNPPDVFFSWEGGWAKFLIDAG